MKSRDYICDWLQDNLRPGRYTHTLGTEKIAKRLAKKHGLDADKAAMAGLCHDCAKYLTDDQMMAEAKANHIEIDEIILNNPHLLHAPVGAIVARREFDIKDKEILSAIANHSYPSKDMSQLDMLINMCDIIEENRPFKDIESARAAAEISIEAGFKETTIRLMTYLLKRGIQIHPNSLYMYNKLVGK